MVLWHAKAWHGDGKARNKATAPGHTTESNDWAARLDHTTWLHACGGGGRLKFESCVHRLADLADHTIPYWTAAVLHQSRVPTDLMVRTQ